MRRIALLVGLAVLAGCGESPPSPSSPRESPSAARPDEVAAGGRWPGTVAYSAEVGPATGLDLFVRAPGRKARRLTDGAVNEFSPSWARGPPSASSRIRPGRPTAG